MVCEKPTPFVPRYLRREVTERISYKGDILTPLSEEDICAAVEYLKKEQVEAIAVCYINSYANEAHERKTVEKIKKLWPEVYVCPSVDITKEWREYERTSTAVLNAYVMPVASSYLNRLGQRLTCLLYTSYTTFRSFPFPSPWILLPDSYMFFQSSAFFSHNFRLFAATVFSSSVITRSP